MSIEIEDGTGSGLRAKVDVCNRLTVKSVSFSESAQVSREDGLTYLWTSSYSAGTGQEVIYIKNTSTTQDLVIDKATVNGVLTGLFELNVAAGTAGGTTITGTNANRTKNNKEYAALLTQLNTARADIEPQPAVDIPAIGENQHYRKWLKSSYEHKGK